MQYIKQWYARTLANPQVFILSLLLMLGLLVVIFTGQWLVPVFTAVIIAYLLEGPVEFLEKKLKRRFPAVIVVFLLFLAFTVFSLVLIVPLLIKQITQLLNALPGFVMEMHAALMLLPEKYPEIISERWITDLVSVSQTHSMSMINRALAYSATSILWVAYVILYLIIVPLMVFFFLKDKDSILSWCGSLMPRDRALALRVWMDVDLQLGNYVRGKFIEILIVWSVSFVVFAILGLPYSALIGLVVGLSVLVPYVGASVVTIPIAVVAYLEWGFDAQFLWVMIAYAIIQALDGNLLAPLLFAEVVNLHPVAIIVAVLLFGGLWGFWGVFFAIPLATVIKAVIDAWPKWWKIEEEEMRKKEKESSSTESEELQSGADNQLVHDAVPETAS